MLTEYGFPLRYWPEDHWPGPDLFLSSVTLRPLTRRVRAQRWAVHLRDSSGNLYAVGVSLVNRGDTVRLPVPPGVPDGDYEVLVSPEGIAWGHTHQRPVGSVRLDRSGSEPIASVGAVFSKLRYDTDTGWLRLLWDGDVPDHLSGLVSAGIWLGDGVPDFAADSPTVTIPLFTGYTTHSYILRVDGEGDSVYPARAYPGYHWPEYWAPATYEWAYAGVAPIDADGNLGSGIYISLPDRSVTDPAAVVETGA